MAALTTGLVSLLSGACQAEDQPARLFELRIYHAAEGRGEDMLARFRDHTLDLFARHGMGNVGYWVPVEGAAGAGATLYYVLSFPDREAHGNSWEAFLADPEWLEVKAATEAKGKIVDRIESFLMSPTDFSPDLSSFDNPEGKGRVFELRTYTTTEGNLPALLSRFRDHTLALFASHGMTNLPYWTLLEDQEGAGETLIYLLAHDSQEAATASFAAFRSDPRWLSARSASEESAGGSLTIEGGVVSLFLTPTDFSPAK
jgi:hypothetical protein